MWHHYRLNFVPLKSYIEAPTSTVTIYGDKVCKKIITVKWNILARALLVEHTPRMHICGRKASSEYREKAVCKPKTWPWEKAVPPIHSLILRFSAFKTVRNTFLHIEHFIHWAQYLVLSPTDYYFWINFFWLFKNNLLPGGSGACL